MNYKKGDRIYYIYRHHLNSRSSTLIIKQGTFIRKVKGTFNDKVVVKLDKNKNNTTISISKIKLIK